MGLFKRMEMVFKSKINKMITHMEDPRETLDYSYEKQLEMLQNVKRGVAEVVSSKKRLQLQRAKITKKLEKLEKQAKEAIAAEREELSRLALERKAVFQQQIADINAEILELEKQEEKLIISEKRLSTKVEIFRTRKEAIKAQYSAAEAQVRINESFSGISEEMADVGLALERAENKMEEMKARSEALDELMEAGTLSELPGQGQDEIEKELSRISREKKLESELSKLKAEVGKEESQ